MLPTLGPGREQAALEKASHHGVCLRRAVKIPMRELLLCKVFQTGRGLQRVGKGDIPLRY